MKNFSLVTFVVALFVFGGCSKSDASKDAPENPQGYIDLGLPSGTLWKNQNEDGFYAYDEAVSKFGSKLPTKDQCEELKNYCDWTWTGDGYRVKGSNGNFIFLPAAGYCDCNGSVNFVGLYGYYWSSSPSDSDHAWRLGFISGGVDLGDYYRCVGRSVRLVQ